MKTRLANLPLRLTLPIAVLVAFLAVTVVSLFISGRMQHRDLLHQAEIHAAEDAARFARLAEDEMDHDMAAIQREVTLHVAEGPAHVAMTVLTDAEGRVLFAHRSDWQGKPAAEVLPVWSRERFRQVLATGTADLAWDRESNRLSMLASYAGPSLDGTARRRPAGAVYLEYDLAQAVHEARLSELERRLVDLVILLILAGQLAYWLHRHLAAPVAELAGAVRRIGAGELDTPVEVRGPGEIAQLAEGVRSMARQLREEQETAERQATSLFRLSQAVEQSPESFVITDLQGRIEYVNEAFVRNTGYSRTEVLGQNPRMLNSGKTPRETYQALWDALTHDRSWQGEFVNRRKDGSEYIESVIISPIHDSLGRVTNYLAVKQDITEKKWAEAELHRLTYHDPLTELPNRLLFLDRLTQVLAVSQRQGRRDAVLMIDIDRFKNINEALGHDLGDALLFAIGERLSRVLREGDTLARLTADEFAILLPDLGRQRGAAAGHAMTVAEKIHTQLRGAFRVGGERIDLTASLGIALFPEGPGDEIVDIMRRAETAMHRAKEEGGGRTAFFEADMGEAASQRFRVERELRQAIPGGELRLYLQPQVNAEGRTVGAEALVRWQHPERGLVPPGVFVPVAEETELIIDLETWVLSEVCHILAEVGLDGRPLRIAVNVSPRHFRHPGFCSWIRDLLTASGADPTRLMLEVTEGLMIDNIGEVVAKMSNLSSLGIHFSVDDFGTGYSSLAYIKRLPIHELKIDKSFVQDAPTDPNDGALVETILAVASHLHLQVVAEGVETAEQAAFLNARGNVIHQGYYYGRPEPAEQWLAQWLAEG